MVEHAILLVGGFGTRLQPLTLTCPKPMLPIVDKPFLLWQLQHLRDHGIKSVTFACGFMPDQIQSYFGDGNELGMKLNYAIEPKPLDTAGAIAFAADTVPRQTMLVCNGDVLTDIDLRAHVAAHEQLGASATLALIPVDDPTRYGLVKTDSHHSVTGFVEKPPLEECDTNLINAGVYVLSPEALDLVPADEPCNIEREIFPQLVGRGLHAIGYESAYWNDIGTHQSYLSANQDMLPADHPWVSERAVVGDAVIKGKSIIGAGAVIGDGAVVINSVVMPGAVVGADMELVDAIYTADGDLVST